MNPFRSKLTDLWRLGTAPWRTWNLRRHVSRRTVPVFALFYHRVADISQNGWTIPFADFRAQLMWMRDRFEFVTLEECQNRMRTGNDQPALTITFDDGYAENSEQAIPFLLAEKIPFTYFVTTEHTTNQKQFPHDADRGEPLPVDTVETLKALANAGVEIGGHSRSHPDFGKVTEPERIFDEVIVATKELEQAIGNRIRYFAFPYGQYCNLNNDVFHLLKESGFDGVCSAYGGWNNIGEDAFHIQRVHGDPDFTRMKNWLGYDPRFAKVQRYDWSQSSIDWSTWLKELESESQGLRVPDSVPTLPNPAQAQS